MKQLRKIWRETLRPLWFDYEWPVVGALALGVVVLGCFGFRLQLQGEGRPTVVVRMAQDAGLAVLLRDVDAGSERFRDLRAFGLLDRTCHPDQVLRGTHEILARAIHEEYLRQ